MAIIELEHGNPTDPDEWLTGPVVDHPPSAAELASGVTSVRLEDTGLGDPDLAAVGELFRANKQLTHLDLRRNFGNFTDAGAAQVFASGAFAHLATLNLDSCYTLGSQTLRAIITGGCPTLRKLAFSNTAVDPADLVSLGTSTQLRTLEELRAIMIASTVEQLEAFVETGMHERLKGVRMTTGRTERGPDGNPL